MGHYRHTVDTAKGTLFVARGTSDGQTGYTWGECILWCATKGTLVYTIPYSAAIRKYSAVVISTNISSFSQLEIVIGVMVCDKEALEAQSKKYTL